MQFIILTKQGAQHELSAQLQGTIHDRGKQASYGCSWAEKDHMRML